jgi:magnesium transporter
LTLEDILQQEPREKLELFPRLGYYFVSCRAIESKATRERCKATHADQSEYRGDGGVVGEANVYLVVFREGICSVSCINYGDVPLLRIPSVPLHGHRR